MEVVCKVACRCAATVGGPKQPKYAHGIRFTDCEYVKGLRLMVFVA